METKETIVAARTLVLHPYIKKVGKGLRTPEHRLEEAMALAEAIDLQVEGAFLAPLTSITPATYIGSGKVEEITEFVKANHIQLVIMDCPLAPTQQRNLEQAWGCKAIDRTALILEIFGARARTREGVLQVELAALEYQKSRLVKSWTHLERQRGGFGFIGGPGETQLEVDRRIIRDRIAKIKKDLEKVTNTRALHRKNRDAVPYPIVALVGYTNAGKSTLFNKLTGDNVFVKDMLFATLDPTMRQLPLPSGQKVILSDTVGFISELPTQLVAAFRATLEEVIEADLILHVRDISSPDTDAQRIDVEQVLKELGIEAKMKEAMFEVWNKIDLLENDAKPGNRGDNRIAVSALTGDGIEDLLAEVDRFISGSSRNITLTLPASEGRILAWIYDHGKDVEQKQDEDSLTLHFRMTEKDIEQLKKLGGRKISLSDEKESA